jgi:tetratricopeptide (TPR) repeat protein
VTNLALAPIRGTGQVGLPSWYRASVEGAVAAASWPRITLALTLAVTGPLTAQQHEGDEAWNGGRLDQARQAYQQVLAGDSTAFVANLRLGLMLAWRGKLDSALALIARARRAEPREPEARLIEAKVLAWDRRFGPAMARYDSALTDQPGLVEAELGRARIHAWRGDLEAAERGYRAVLTTEPHNADALAGLGYVYHWQGRDGPAERLAVQAQAADSTNGSARDLARAVRGAVRPATEISANWSDDSDENTSFWQTIAGSGPVAPGLRAFGNVGVLEATDPFRHATRFGGEGGLIWSLGDVQLTGAAGGRRLVPEIAAARTAATYRGRLSWRPVRRLGASIGYARSPFDEIASLIERDLNLESLEAGFDAAPARGLSVFGGGGAVWFSDGNHRTQAAGGLTQRVSGGLFVGAYGRALGYRRVGLGYFSPDRFHLLEGVAGYNLETAEWDGRLSAGLGGQRLGRAGTSQTEWHVDLRLGRRWGVGNRVDLFGSVTNSAVSSTSGAFRFGTAGLSVRVGM